MAVVACIAQIMYGYMPGFYRLTPVGGVFLQSPALLFESGQFCYQMTTVCLSGDADMSLVAAGDYGALVS